MDDLHGFYTIRNGNMKHNIKSVRACLIGAMQLCMAMLFPLPAQSGDGGQVPPDAGYFAREDIQGEAARTTGNSIYIKFYPDRWVAVLYVPYPYSTTLQPAVLHSIFKEVGQHERRSAFIRSKYGQLEEPAVVHLEEWRMEDGKFLFDCGGQMPCVVTIDEKSLEMVKKGIIGEHIIKFVRVEE